MSVSVSVNISGDTATIDKINALKESLENFSQAFKTLGAELVSYASNQVFSTQGGVYGTPWKSLAASTQAYKVKHYRQYASLPLIATGLMKNSFDFLATPNTLTIGNTAPYFVYHQSSAPRTKLPRREMLGVNVDVESIIKQVIDADIRDKLTAAGL
jgi:phage gpG-like protein